MKTRLIIPFLLCLCALLSFPYIFSGFSFIYFSIFLVIASYRTSFHHLLWLAAGSGLCVDIFTSTHFGLYATAYTMTSALFFLMKKFFNDKILGISLAIICFSLSFSLIEFFLIFIFEKGVLFSWKWVVSDLFLMSLFDAIYGILWVVMPLRLITWIKRQWPYLLVRIRGLYDK